MRKLTTAAMMLAVLALGATEVSAQAVNARVTIPQVLQLTYVSDLAIDFAATAFDVADQATASGTVQIDTRANVPHRVDVSGADLVITTAGSTASTLTLEFTRAGGSTYEPLTGTDAPILDGLIRGTNTGTVTFQTTATVVDHDAGTYEGTITYTLVSTL